MTKQFQSITLSKIEVEPQVRKVIDENKLKELAQSMQVHGLIEPIIVRSKKGDNATFVVEKGERRFRAAQLLGWRQIDAIIADTKPADVTVTQIIENLQREDMNEMDLAEGFQKVMKDREWKMDQLCENIGKSKSFVKQRLALLKAAPEVREALRRGDIEFSAARNLCTLPVEEQASTLASAIAEEDEVRKVMEEKKPKIVELPGLNPEDEAEAAEGEETAEATDGVKTSKKKSKKPVKAKASAKKAPKVKTSTVKRVTRRKKIERSGRQLSTKALEERLETRTQEWVKGFLDEDTKGKGLEDSISSAQARNLLKRFVPYLLTQKALVVR